VIPAAPANSNLRRSNIMVIAHLLFFFCYNA